MTAWLGAAGLAGCGLVAAAERSTVIYRVKGFTCVTCPVGLESLLRRERGVVRTTASYPEGMARIEF